MAKLTKTGARKPLAQGDTALIYSHGSGSLTLSIQTDETTPRHGAHKWLSLELSAREVENLIAFYSARTSN